MKRVTLTVVTVLLAVPALAHAKGGVIFDRYPDAQQLGSPMTFTVMTLPAREGIRPLVTFRNAKTGEVVRVRASRSDLNGIAYGTVRIPSTGPWATDITFAGKPVVPDDDVPFRVGVGLTQTIPSADATRAASAPPAASSFPWLWLTSAGAIGSALLVLVMRRRWGSA